MLTLEDEPLLLSAVLQAGSHDLLMLPQGKAKSIQCWEFTKLPEGRCHVSACGVDGDLRLAVVGEEPDELVVRLEQPATAEDEEQSPRQQWKVKVEDAGCFGLMSVYRGNEWRLGVVVDGAGRASVRLVPADAEAAQQCWVTRPAR